eukprot:Colp12_sorted_trinity150504_noHs@19220
MAELDRITKELSKLEILGEDILVEKQQIVDFDRKRNTNREALGSFRRKEHTDKKAWTWIGSMFIKLPSDATIKLLEEDQKRLDSEISQLRDSVKRKSEELMRLQGDEQRMQGFSLKALSEQEVRGAAKKKVHERTL